MSTRKNFAAVTLLAIAAVAVLAVVFVAVCALVGDRFDDPFDDHSFTPADWRAADRDGRARMCRDLIARHVTAGTSAPEVEVLLGKPDRVYRAGERSHLVGSRTYVYPIGSWSSWGMDDAFLYVHLDTNDRVIKAEIYGY